MDAIDYGVCRLSVVPVRLAPSDKAEQVTQLLFGDLYEVLALDPTGGWCRIRIAFDAYEGWVDYKQHHRVSVEYFAYCNKAEFKITTDLTSSMLYNKSPQLILIGSMIPISSSELFKMEEQFAFNGEAKNLGQKREADFIRQIARKYLNAPYQWGGKTPFGIDCSGFVQMVYKIAGYKLGRDSSQQATQGREVPLAEAKPGDLAFFARENGQIYHVGILQGGEKIIHSSGFVRVDAIDAQGIIHAITGEYTHKLAAVRRILPD